ncbi:hypothetical protein V8E53_003402 [Lactarius tabidus]
MTPFSQLPLPFLDQSPDWEWEERDEDSVLLPIAFNASINQRDKFLGQQRCVICGVASDIVLEHCHIVGGEDEETWSDLKSYGWIPLQTRFLPQHEPRNGLLLCSHHRIWFDNYYFFLRFSPKASFIPFTSGTRKLVFINYSGDPELQKHHGKAIAIDLEDCCAPFPSLFLIHEMRVRAFRPFAPLNPSIPGDSPWQEWIESDGVFDHFSDSFKRDNLPDNSVTVPPRHQVLPAVTNAGGVSSGERLLESLDTDVVAEILTATRAMPSWKDCEEGKSWTGTAEENIQKYLSSIHNTHRVSSSCDPL